MTNQDYMKRALELAKKAMGIYFSPNPMVGCVVVKDGRIVTEGYHERCGRISCRAATPSPNAAKI